MPRSPTIDNALQALASCSDWQLLTKEQRAVIENHSQNADSQRQDFGLYLDMMPVTMKQTWLEGTPHRIRQYLINLAQWAQDPHAVVEDVRHHIFMLSGGISDKMLLSSYSHYRDHITQVLDYTQGVLTIGKKVLRYNPDLRAKAAFCTKLQTEYQRTGIKLAARYIQLKKHEPHCR